MTRRRLQLMAQTTDRAGAGARRLVFREKAHNSALADRFQVVPFLSQPMGEVGDAAQIGALCARRISPSNSAIPRKGVAGAVLTCAAAGCTGRKQRRFRTRQG